MYLIKLLINYVFYCLFIYMLINTATNCYLDEPYLAIYY